MKFTPLSLDGLIQITPRVFEDERGFFMESFRKTLFQEAGVDCEFVQNNHSRSKLGTIRGLHYQSSPGQAKLVRCTRGKIWDVAVDIRPNSPTFGQWKGVELSEENFEMLFVPVGFAHGFAVLSETAEIQYKCSAYYNAETECGIAWDDADLAIEWPVSVPILSARDQALPSFQEYQAGLR